MRNFLLLQKQESISHGRHLHSLHLLRLLFRLAESDVHGARLRTKIPLDADFSIQILILTISTSSYSSKTSNVDRKVPLKMVGSSVIVNVKRFDPI